MAVITPIDVGQLKVIRTGTAQADTGQTDWFRTPSWASHFWADFNLTAVAGNTPQVTAWGMRILDLSTSNDASAQYMSNNFFASATLTAATRLLVQAGPGVTGIANDTTTAVSGTVNMSGNFVLPPLMGIRIAFDRTTGDEVYTYTLTAGFR